MTRNNKIKLASISSIASICLLAALTAGCENADPDPNVSWNGVSPQPAAPAQPQAPASDGSGTPTVDNSGGSAGDSTGGVPGVGTHADQASFSSFRWSYGGFNGGGASHSGVNISGLNFSKRGLSFRYDKNLSAWGFSNGQIGALACLFVQKSDGSWVGGKFDWISSSRTSRSFENVFHGYEGWSLAGVPNPCKAAFVIVHSDGRKRSNVLVGNWTR